jgi:hypothetical protein
MMLAKPAANKADPNSMSASTSFIPNVTRSLVRYASHQARLFERDQNKVNVEDLSI